MSLRRMMMAGGAGSPTDPNWANVSSLLHFDGTDGSTTLTDQKGKTWTAAGNAQIDTAQSKFGTASCLYDGSGDYIYGNGSTDFAFGSGDFTVELWVRPAALTGPHILFDFRPAGTNSGDYPYCYIDATNIVYNTNATDRIVAAHGISTGSWVHIALARASNVARVFVGGTQKGSGYTNAQSMLVGTNRPTFGATGGNTAGQFGFNGHHDDIRITKGVARYTANFTPPTAAFPDS